MIVLPSRADVVDYEDQQAQVACLAGSSKNKILEISCKNALQPWLAFVGQAWDAAIDTHTTWRVLKDGCVIYQLKDSKVQIAPPEQAIQELSPWIQLPQQAIVRFEADLDNTAAGNVTARLRIYYTQINPGV